MRQSAGIVAHTINHPRDVIADQQAAIGQLKEFRGPANTGVIQAIDIETVSDNNRQGFPNPDEINWVSGPGLHFGVPYLFGKGTPGFTQEEYQNPGVIQPPLVPGAIVSDKAPGQVSPADYVPAAFELGTNTAPLGVRFWKGYPTANGTQRLLVAVHGAGSAASPGMDVQMLTIQGGTRVVNQIPLINGFVQDPDTHRQTYP